MQIFDINWWTLIEYEEEDGHYLQRKNCLQRCYDAYHDTAYLNSINHNLALLHNNPINYIETKARFPWINKTYPRLGPLPRLVLLISLIKQVELIK